MESPQGDISKNHTNTIFVGGLPGTAEKSAICRHFSRFGNIENIKLKLDKKSNLSKGYALVTFLKQVSYEAAIKVPEHYLFSRCISCQPFLEGEKLSSYLEDLNSRRLFVKYIPKSYNNQEFEDLFRKYGDVDFGYVVKDPKTARSRGFGYITFKKSQDAIRIQKMRCIKLKGNKKMKIFAYKRRNSGEGQMKKERGLRSIQAPKRLEYTEVFEKKHKVKKEVRPFQVKDMNLPSKPRPVDIQPGKIRTREPESSKHLTKNDTNFLQKGVAIKQKGITSPFASYQKDQMIPKELRMRNAQREIWKKFDEDNKENDYPDYLKLQFFLPITGDM